jgi:hypothetical protein
LAPVLFWAEAPTTKTKASSAHQRGRFGTRDCIWTALRDCNDFIL